MEKAIIVRHDECKDALQKNALQKDAFCKARFLQRAKSKKQLFEKRLFAKNSTDESCLCWAPDAGQRLLGYRWTGTVSCPAWMPRTFAAQDTKIVQLIWALKLVPDGTRLCSSCTGPHINRPALSSFCIQEPHLFCGYGWAELKIEHIIRCPQKQNTKLPINLPASTNSSLLSLTNEFCYFGCCSCPLQPNQLSYCFKLSNCIIKLIVPSFALPAHLPLVVLLVWFWWAVVWDILVAKTASPSLAQLSFFCVMFSCWQPVCQTNVFVMSIPIQTTNCFFSCSFLMKLRKKRRRKMSS